MAAYQVATRSFAWTDISSQGTALSLGDDGSAQVPIGFTFNFLGGAHTQVFVNANGNLTFGGAHGDYNNASLATASVTNILALFWDDLNPGKSGQVRFATLGSAGSRRFIASYNNVPHYSTSGGGSFQAVLFEADSSIEFHYQDVSFGSSSYNGGKSATIGVKGGPVTQWSHNTSSVSDGSALRFTVPAPANAAPQAANDSYATDEDTALVVAAPGILGNDTDADGDPLTAALASGPSNGSLTLNANGSFTYTPNAGFAGTDSFTYVASDGAAMSSEATVTITVAAGGIHVGDLDGSRKNQPQNRWNATVSVLVHGTSHAALAGATVSISATGQGIGTLTGTGTTASNGWVTFELANISKSTTPSVTFTVTNVTHSSAGYNATLNHDPDGDSSGTSITVLRP